MEDDVIHPRVYLELPCDPIPMEAYFKVMMDQTYVIAFEYRSIDRVVIMKSHLKRRQEQQLVNESNFFFKKKRIT